MASEDKYCDGFDETYVAWTETPALPNGSPYLHDDDTTNYISTNVDAAMEGYFGFADTTFDTITDVHLWVKAKLSKASDNYASPYNADGILLGTVAPTTTSYAWYQADTGTQLDYLNTPALVNAFKVKFEMARVAGSNATISITCAYLAITGSVSAGQQRFTLINMEDY